MPIRILERRQSWTHSRWIDCVYDDPRLLSVGIIPREFYSYERLTIRDHPLGRAPLEPIGNDHEVAGVLDRATDFLDRAIMVSGDRNRHVLGIEINRIAEEHDLDRRNQQDQRNGRRIPHEVQYLYMGHSQHPSEVAP